MKKRNVMILVILLVIGFASVSTSLILNGTIGIGANEDDFDVIFTEATINGEGSTATIDETKRTITFTSSKLININEKAVLDYKIKNNSTQYDADVTINCTNEASEYIKVTNELAGEEITENYKTTFSAQEEKSGVITAELIKSATQDTDSVSVTCTIVANATERDNAVEPFVSPWKITEDNDNNGEVSNGDLITLGTESFYVYDIEGDKVKAISQYNLYVGDYNYYDETLGEQIFITLENPTGLQDSRAKGTIEDKDIAVGVVPFTTNKKYNELKNSSDTLLNMSDYSISVIKDYVDSYKKILDALNGNTSQVRLITKEELEALGCSGHSCSSAPSYIYATSYWTSTPDEDSWVWYVGSDGYFHIDAIGDGYSEGYSNEDGYYGVRPVIEVSKSVFE